MFFAPDGPGVGCIWLSLSRPGNFFTLTSGTGASVHHLAPVRLATDPAHVSIDYEKSHPPTLATVG